ncbi:MAG: SH3 domain-containing protein [Clostridiales bacterium]|nr:SH3 domain-containing protein [Clostridiales bacterium]
MKRRSIAFVLMLALAFSMLAGCGSTGKTEEAAVEETTEEEVEVVEETDPEPVYEEVNYTVEIAVANADGTFSAYDETAAYLITLAEKLSSEEQELFTEGAVLTVTTVQEVTEEEITEDADEAEEAAKTTDSAVDTDDSEEQTEIIKFNYDEVIEIIAVAAAAVEEPDGYTLSQQIFENLNGYTIEDLAETTMYASNAVNVRSEPSAESEKLGALSAAAEVIVNGLTSANWYRISYNDGVAYVSANYLTNEKPTINTASSGASSSPNSSETDTNSTESSSSDTTLEYEELRTQRDTAVAEGRYEDAYAINQQLLALSSGGSSSSTSGSSTSTAIKSTTTSTELFNLVNAQRESEGVVALTWDDSLEQIALQRAEELVEDFSHSQMQTIENIHKTTSGNASDWFTAFYNSNGHRITMMSSTYAKTATAVCQYGNWYYVIQVFGR